MAAQEQKARDRYAQQMINISKSVADATQTNSKFIKQQKEMIDDTLAEYYSDRVAAFDVDSKTQMTTIIDTMKEQYASEFAAEQSKLESLSKEISSYQAKRDAINSEILRQRAIREQQDFYRIVLPEDSKQDISYILSIITQFKHPQTLYKLIWSEYIQRPFQSMFKNVASGADPRNVIYKITNLTTGEIYIGKTKQELSKRWSDHIKTSLYITDSTPKAIHKALYNNWDNFSFEILEKVPLTEDLGTREKYYIDFYQSNIYGYNMVSGG